MKCAYQNKYDSADCRRKTVQDGHAGRETLLLTAPSVRPIPPTGILRTEGEYCHATEHQHQPGQ